MLQYRKRAHRRHQRLTIMLLSVTLAFIGLTCPSVIFICVNKIIYSMRLQTDNKPVNLNELVSVSPPSNVQLIVDVCEALWYTKHAMNFILYTLSGQDFRREFLKLFTQHFNHRSFFIRKLVNKTQTTTTTTAALLSESTLDTQLRVTNTHNKLFLRKKPINHTHDISTSLEFKSLSEHQ
jgi:hypothetical protein